MPIKKIKKTPPKSKKAPSRTRGLKPPFKPGQSGNPAGRPKDTPEQKAEKAANKVLDSENRKIARELMESGEYSRLMKIAMKNAAADGKMSGFEFLNKYVDGPPVEKREISGPEGGPISISVTFK